MCKNKKKEKSELDTLCFSVTYFLTKKKEKENEEYSKALSGMFFGERKTRLAQNSCNLSYYLNKAKARSKKMCSSRFSLHKLDPIIKQGLCNLRSCSSRPYCNEKLT